jgi:hypothetical protein
MLTAVLFDDQAPGLNNRMRSARFKRLGLADLAAQVGDSEGRSSTPLAELTRLLEFGIRDEVALIVGATVRRRQATTRP